MEILVYMTEDDKKDFDVFVDYCVNNRTTAYIERDKYFCKLIAKYPVLKNFKLGINRPDGYVFQYNSDKDLYLNARTGSIYV